MGGCGRRGCARVQHLYNPGCPAHAPHLFPPAGPPPNAAPNPWPHPPPCAELTQRVGGAGPERAHAARRPPAPAHAGEANGWGWVAGWMWTAGGKELGGCCAPPTPSRRCLLGGAGIPPALYSPPASAPPAPRAPAQAIVDLPPDVARLANQAVYMGGDALGGCLPALLVPGPSHLAHVLCWMYGPVTKTHDQDTTPSA